jgi:hypothetical protein
MALSRVKVWSSNEILTAAALNAEFNNLLNNAAALISPLTGNLDLGSNAILNLDSLTFNDMLVSPATAGQLQRNGALLQYYDGTRSHSLLSAQAPANFNYIFNGDFEIWGGGGSAAPTGWTLVGAGATISRNSGGVGPRTGTFFLDMTRAGTDCRIEQDVAAIYPQISWWQGKTVTFGCLVRTAVANAARIMVTDGSGSSTMSGYHAGDDVWRWMTVTHTIASGATSVFCYCRIDNTNALVKFDGATLVIGTSLADFLPSGWRGRKAIMQGGSVTTTVPAGSTYYLHPAGTASTDLVTGQTPFKGVARNLYVLAGTAPGAASFVYTCRTNVGDTALTVTLTGGSRTSSNVTAEVEVPKGSGFNVKLVTSAGAPVAAHAWAVEYEEIP